MNLSKSILVAFPECQPRPLWKLDNQLQINRKSIGRLFQAPGGDVDSDPRRDETDAVVAEGRQAGARGLSATGNGASLASGLQSTQSSPTN